CADTCTFERTIRSVATDPVDYQISATTGTGVALTATPSSFTLPAGGTQTIEFEFDVSAATGGEWTFGEIAIQESGTTVGVSDARLAYALVPQDPAPIARLSKDSIVVTQERDEITQEQFSGHNAGALALEWSATQFDSQLTATANGKLWGNARAGSSGSINNYVDPANVGYYQSDYFLIHTQSEIKEIRVDGFFLGGSLSQATELTWAVYADANGVPAGHPDLSPGDALWTFSAAPGAAGVDISDEAMNLDLDAAAAPTLDLAAGKYWLVAFPSLQTFSQQPAYLYAWFNGIRGDGRVTGMLGGMSSWEQSSSGRSFELYGSVDCSGGGYNPWIDFSPTSGTLTPGQSETVSVSFYSNGMQEGSYESALCVTTNDPEQPFILLPVALNVVNLPAASVAPGALDFQLEYGQTDSKDVVIGNSGLGELEFSLSSAAD